MRGAGESCRVVTFSLEWLAGAGVGLVLLDEGHDVDQVEDVTVIVTGTGSIREERDLMRDARNLHL